MRNSKEERLALREERRNRLKKDKEKREIRYSKIKEEIKKENTKKSSKKYSNLEVFILMLACVSLGLLIGMRLNKAKDAKEDMLKDSVAFDIYKDIQENYYGIILDNFEYKQISGMIQGLNDPYARYLEGNYALEYKQELNNEFVGIGTEVQMTEDKDVVFINIFPDTPAEKAGIQKGDILVKINGNDLIGLTLDQIVFKIKGKATKKDVDITINRNGEYMDLTITKENIVPKSVTVNYLKDDSIAVVTIKSFTTKTLDEFKKIIEEVKEKNISYLAIDVRDNSVASDIASLFLDKGTVIYKEKYNNSDKTIKTDKKKEYDFNLAVVINNYSAKASEVLATALRDQAGAYIIGIESKGDSTIQKMIELENGNIVEYTVGRWLTSKGTSVGSDKLLPNYKVTENNYDEKIIEAFNNNI